MSKNKLNHIIEQYMQELKIKRKKYLPEDEANEIEHVQNGGSSILENEQANKNDNEWFNSWIDKDKRWKKKGIFM